MQNKIHARRIVEEDKALTKRKKKISSLFFAHPLKDYYSQTTSY